MQNTVGWPSHASTLCPKRHYMHVISNMGTIWVVIRQISEGSATDLFILSILFYRTHQKHYIRFKQETIKKTLILLQGYVNISSLHNGVIILYILGRWVILVFWHLVLHMLSPNITCHITDTFAIIRPIEWGFSARNCNNKSVKRSSDKVKRLGQFF